MDYRKIYDSIIQRGKERVPEGYVERHHIVPECMGGPDTKENMVALYPEEHFLAHVLLVKIYPESPYLICAVQKMTQGHEGKRIRRKLYGWLKRKHAAYMRESQTGTGNSQHGTMWISDVENQVSKKWKTAEPIPNGWVKGRKSWNRKRCLVCNSLIFDQGSWCKDHQEEKKNQLGKESSARQKGIKRGSPSSETKTRMSLSAKVRAGQFPSNLPSLRQIS